MSEAVTRHQKKRHNQRLVLKAIYAAGSISRADVARETKLTRTTISSTVSGLIDAGLVVELGQVANGRGKPPTLLKVVEQARCVIGVDISNRDFQGGLFDLRGNPLTRLRMAVDRTDSESVYASLLRLIDALIAAAEHPVLGIGIGTPGLLDMTDGIVREAVNLGWHDFPLQQRIADTYQLPVHVVNDSQAAALAQYTFDNRDKLQDLIVVKIGQGISAGIVINGQLYNGGNRFGASEIGHLRVTDGGEPCVCGHFGCLETVASSRALVRQARTLAEHNHASILHQIAERPAYITTDHVLAAFKSGDSAVIQMVEQAGRNLGIVIASLVGVLNIPRIVISGSLARFGPTLIDAIRGEMGQRALQSLVEMTEVTLSTLELDIVILGAASLVLHHQVGVI